MRKFLKLTVLCLAAALLLGLPICAAAADAGSDSTNPTTEPAVSEDFSCYTYDPQGNPLYGYWSETEEMWYLFVTSTQSIADTNVYYTGSVSQASAGELDKVNKVVTGAFRKSGDKLLLDSTDGIVHGVVVMQSGLPSVHITLKGTSLEEIHADKDVKHKGNSIYILDPGGKYDLTVEGSLEIKGRGNSTWREYEKKAYQIKFDSKTSVLGMGKAKKWVLLANASDDSMMRTQLIYNMAGKMGMDFVCSLKYVDLWIDGEYRGTFLLGDKVEIGSSRLDLSEDTGALFEHDEAFYMEEDYWVYSTMLGRHFVMKEIVEEEDAFIEAAMTDFEKAVDELTAYLYSTPSYEVTLKDLSTMIDVDSFAKYYLVNEYALNRESFATSFYWYKDGANDVIHLGPLWDFDTCMGNDGAAYTESYGDEHILFRYLLAAPEFYNRTLELLESYRDELKSMTEDVDAIKAEIAASAEMNYLRWDTLGKPNPKGGVDFYPTYDEAVDAVRTWLRGRETAFRVADCDVVTSVVSEDCYDMAVTFWDGKDHSRVMFGVWSLENGQDDLNWYAGGKDSNGAWHYTVDLGKHNSAGMYRIDAIVDDGTIASASGRNYVDTARPRRFYLDAEVSGDCEIMTVTLRDSGFCADVTFAVWSDENGQDDLNWYPATKNADGLWVCDVALNRHQSAGKYYIHAYTGTGGARRVADTMMVNVPFAVSGPTVRTQLSEDGTLLTVTVENVEGYKNLWLPVWSVENGQDDMVWYEMNSAGRGTWTCTVDLCLHGAAGEYKAHVYGGNTSPQELVAYTGFSVDKKPVRRIMATVSEDCSSMEIILRELEGDWETIWVPVWSMEKGQDDIRWYKAAKQKDGTYLCIVNLEDHKSAGEYLIHVYGGDNNRPDTLLDTATAMVSAVPGTRESVKATVDGDDLILALKNTKDWQNVWFAVWSEEKGQDDLRWYMAQKQEKGTYTCVVDLTAHKSVGKYHIHTYGGSNSPEAMLHSTSAVVDVMPGTVSYAKASVDGNQMTVVLRNAGDWKTVWFPVWSEEKGQDDIQWYRAEKQDNGSYVYTVNLTRHGSIGRYLIHVYGGDENPETLICCTDTVVTELPAPKATVKAAVDGNELTILLENIGDWENVWIPVWSRVNDQDDIRWYIPDRQADGSWKTVVDLRSHGDPGLYNIHVYGGKAAPEELLLDTTVQVDSIETVPVIKASVASGGKLTLTVQNVEEHGNLWLAVWNSDSSRDNLCWYVPVEQDNGNWQYTVELSAHGGNGIYHVHAYTGGDAPAELVAYTDIVIP